MNILFSMTCLVTGGKQDGLSGHWGLHDPAGQRQLWRNQDSPLPRRSDAPKRTSDVHTMGPRGSARALAAS